MRLLAIAIQWYRRTARRGNRGGRGFPFRNFSVKPARSKELNREVREEKPRRPLRKSQGQSWRGSVAGGSRHLHGWFLRGGELYDEEGAAFGPVLASNLAVVFLNDAIDCAQTEAGAFADWFGCVEGIEDALGLADARAGVGELQHGLAAQPVGDDFERAAAGFFQRVHGILDDLDEGLKQLVGVALHAGKVRRNRHTDTDFAGGVA